jgi:hypothetical protein
MIKYLKLKTPFLVSITFHVSDMCSICRLHLKSERVPHKGMSIGMMRQPGIANRGDDAGEGCTGVPPQPFGDYMLDNDR